MKRKIASAIILLFVFFSGVVAAGGANGQFAGYDIIKIFSANKELQPEDVPAINFKGRTMVPIGVLKQLGANIKWDAVQQRVDVSMPVRTVPVLTAEQLDSLSKYAYKIVTAPTDGHPNGKLGSGFVIDNYMVTNAHVGADAPYVQFQVNGNWQKVSKYDFVNEAVDIMGFKVSGPTSLPYSTVLPEPGDIIYDISYPAGKLAVTEGKVYSVYPVDGSVTSIVHSAQIAGGSSGGILVNGQGEIIGVNKSGMTTSTGEEINIAIPISYVLDEIKK